MSLWHTLNHMMHDFDNVPMVSMLSSFSSFLHDSLRLRIDTGDGALFGVVTIKRLFMNNF